MEDLVLLGVFVPLGAAPGLIALKFGGWKAGFVAVSIWMLLSAWLLYSIGLGPHGFILFAFMPLWFGGLISFFAVLFRLMAGRRSRISRIESE